MNQLLKSFLGLSLMSLGACEFITSDSSSSSVANGNQSSSVIESSSSSGSYLVDARDQQKYRTVQIGTQFWMAQNLNYLPSGKGSLEAACYHDSSINCTQYGRLYDWKTAMNLPDSCDTADCASKVGLEHQGICPDGWRVPNYHDWTTLTIFTGVDVGMVHLKSAYPEWDGSDQFGFSALPAGKGVVDNYSDSSLYFYQKGEGTWFWSSSQTSRYEAWIKYMHPGFPSNIEHTEVKESAISLRCIKK